MYLVVFATLVVAILGTYTQVLAIEVARIAAAQTSVAQAMISWHTAAVSMAASIINTNNPTNASQYPTGFPNGCSLSYHTAGGASFHPCPSPWNALYPSETAVLNTSCGGLANCGVISNGSSPMLIFSKASGAQECVHLQGTTCNTYVGSNCTGTCTTTFDVNDYEFYSILFRSGGVDYIVTYALQSASSTYIKLPGNTQLSLTPAGLVKQLRNLGLSTASYGVVTGTNPNQTITGAVAMNLAIPSAAGVTTGSVALVSTPLGY